jgi:acetylornithine deacetylase/succinyl-diaminopimelate desuccinylase-like protein
LDFRLVPDQNPDFLFEKLKAHMIKNGFDDIEVVKLGRQEPSRTPPDAPIARVVAAAAKEVFGKDPVVYPISPGSGPNFLFTNLLGLNSVWTGCASAFSNTHAPDEFVLVDDFLKGILYAGAIMEDFAKT